MTNVQSVLLAYVTIFQVLESEIVWAECVRYTHSERTRRYNCRKFEVFDDDTHQYCVLLCCACVHAQSHQSTTHTHFNGEHANMKNDRIKL